MLIFCLKVCKKSFIFSCCYLPKVSSLFVSIPKLRGSVVVIEDAHDFQNLIFPASLVLHAKHKCNICFEENLVLPKMLLQYLGWKPSILEIQ